MNRQEFMKQLEYLLKGIPEQEREDALAYYNDYFDEAGAENEYRVIQELGSPEQVAQTILEDVQRETSQSVRPDYCSPEILGKDAPKQKQRMSKSTMILIVIVLILTFPLWIGIVAGLFGGLVGLLGGLFGIVVGLGGAAIGLVVGGVACMIGGIVCLIARPIEGLACISVGAILTAIGILLALLCVLIVGVWLPKLVKALVNWGKGLFHRKEGGNEI